MGFDLDRLIGRTVQQVIEKIDPDSNNTLRTYIMFSGKSVDNDYLYPLYVVFDSVNYKGEAVMLVREL